MISGSQADSMRIFLVFNGFAYREIFFWQRKNFTILHRLSYNKFETGHSPLYFLLLWSKILRISHNSVTIGLMIIVNPTFPCYSTVFTAKQCIKPKLQWIFHKIIISSSEIFLLRLLFSILYKASPLLYLLEVPLLVLVILVSFTNLFGSINNISFSSLTWYNGYMHRIWLNRLSLHVFCIVWEYLTAVVLHLANHQAATTPQGSKISLPHPE